MISVWQMMSSQTFTLDAGATIRDAAEQLLDRELHGAPVVDADGRLLGVVSVVDLLRSLLRDPAGQRAAVDVATKPALTVLTDEGLYEAAERMVRARVHRLPVIDAAGTLRGVLSPMDVLRGIVNLEEGFRVRRSPQER